MRFRKLRITWTVFCGIACVLLIALWVRSYDTKDMIAGHTSQTRGICAYSVEGWLDVSATTVRDTSRNYGWHVTIGELDPGYHKPTLWRHVFPNFEGSTFRSGFHYQIPYWFLISTSFIFAPVPRLRWRFSLRTLLIATTLVAVALGLIVWLR